MQVSESMRERLLDACEPLVEVHKPPMRRWFRAADAEEILARVLAVLADPDDETVEAVARGLYASPCACLLVVGDDPTCPTHGHDRRKPRAALAALVEHLWET